MPITVVINLTDEQITALDDARTKQIAPLVKLTPMTLIQYSQFVFDIATKSIIENYKKSLVKKIEIINSTEIPTKNMPALITEVTPIVNKYKT